MKFSQEEKQKIKDLLAGAKISYGHFSAYNGGRVLDRVGVVEDLYIKEYKDGKKKWTIKTDFSELPFYDWCASICEGITYKAQSKKIKDLAETYIKAVKQNNDQLFHDFVEKLDEGKFNIVDVDIQDDEIAWLNKHVTNIKATFPKKYEKNFKKNFPDAPYTIHEDAWNYGFTMYFDDLTNVPDSLLELKNRNGNSLEFDNKRMNNTSYIWKLVKNYPQFSFGKRELSK